MDNLQKEMVFEANRKSKGLAYVLWILCGYFGVHRFYAGETKTGAIQLVLALSVIGWPILAVWLLIDLFLIPGMINERNMDLIHALNDDRPMRGQSDERYEVEEKRSAEPVLDSKRARMLEDLRSTGYRKKRREFPEIGG